jgi:hypothetical protein
MKPILTAVAAVILGMSLALTAAAQRHDEKPHGSTKPSASTESYESVPVSGGRHDERPHGARKPAAKKPGPGDAAAEAGKAK